MGLAKGIAKGLAEGRASSQRLLLGPFDICNGEDARGARASLCQAFSQRLQVLQVAKGLAHGVSSGTSTGTCSEIS